MKPAIKDADCCSTMLIVGLGSPFGDDRFGWRVVDRLNVAIRSGHADRVGGEPHDRRDRLEIHKATTPVELLQWLDGVDRLVICDACQGFGETGAVARWRWPTDQIQHIRTGGSHDFPLASVLELATTLGKLPQVVDILAAEISAKTQGTLCPDVSLSPQLEQAAQRVAEEIAKELRLA